jgi:hypothetical protein
MSKQEWFNRGAHTFGQVAPKYRGAGYACPICLGISPSLATFTFEDVPPRSVGGRPLILTCNVCNSKSGHTCDWHWANFWALEGFASEDMKKPVDVEFTYENVTSVAELSNKDGAYVLKIIKKASNPEAVRETERLFGQAVAAKAQPEPMNVTFHKSRFDEHLLKVSVLRAAYLVGIAVAGYSWIRVWEPIRQQILDPINRDESLSLLVRYEREYARDRRSLGIVESPFEMRSFYIGFGRWTIFLPWVRESLLYQPQLMTNQRIEFKGASYEWPKAPTFGLEWPARTS